MWLGNLLGWQTYLDFDFIWIYCQIKNVHVMKQYLKSTKYFISGNKYNFSKT